MCSVSNATSSFQAATPQLQEKVATELKDTALTPSQISSARVLGVLMYQGIYRNEDSRQWAVQAEVTAYRVDGQRVFLVYAVVKNDGNVVGLKSLYRMDTVLPETLHYFEQDAIKTLNNILNQIGM